MQTQTVMKGLRSLAQPNSSGCALGITTTSTSLHPVPHSRLRTVGKTTCNRLYSSTRGTVVPNSCSGPPTSTPLIPPPRAQAYTSSSAKHPTRTIASYALARAFPRRPDWATLNHIRRPGNQARHVNTRSSIYVSPTRPAGTLYSCHNRPILARLKHAPGSLWLELMATTLTQRRGHANKTNGHDDHHHSSDDEHSHSHGIFHSHSHSHSHGADGAQEIIKALSGEGDRGSRITLIGLASNVVLSGAKGVAGVYLNSAALVADAAHSLSDLLGDFVTLACWKISRRPPNDAYPYGYGKFETLGTAIVSLFLVGGAAAIGLHSYTMLLDALSPTVAAMAPGPAHDILHALVGTKESVGGVLSHTHGHAHVEEAGVLDPNAAWFALGSVIVKEWMYRATKNVADDLKSPVLLANAYHHRSDAYSSLVTLVAILGTWALPALPLDPLGGMLVSLLILQQGASLTWTAFGDFTDAGVPAETRQELQSLVNPLLVSPAPHTLLGVRNVRAVRSGSVMFVDLTADVPASMTVSDAHEVERRVRDAIMDNRSEVKEVRVHLHAVEKGDGGENGNGNDNLPC